MHILHQPKALLSNFNNLLKLATDVIKPSQNNLKHVINQVGEWIYKLQGNLLHYLIVYLLIN